MHSKAIALWVIVAAALAGAAIAADGAPPLPRAASGADVTVLARGIPLPAGIAIGKGTVFVAAFGSEDGKTPGGLFRLQGGQATKLADGMYIGLTWHGGTLYAGSLGRTGSQIVAFRGWDGKRFASRKVLRRSPVSFTGLAVGPDGRLYAGGATEDCDLCKQKHALSQTVMSMRLDGTDLRVVSRGLRQPFGIAFARGIPEPFVTVEGQENLGKKEPPDYVVRARAGDDYGFRRCTWAKPSACAGFARPFALLPAHSSPTGIAAIGPQLYLGMFNGTRGPAVWQLPVSGGTWREVVGGFPAPVVGLSASGRDLYVGDLTGTVYRIRQ